MDFPEPPVILKLCECLYASSSVILQKEINKIITKKIQCENALTLFLSDDQKEFYFEVIGERVLNEEMRFGVETSKFKSSVFKKSSVFTDNIKDFFLKYDSSSLEVHSYLSVPLFNSKKSDKILGLLCLINKNSFTLQDSQTVEKFASYVSPLLAHCCNAEEEKKMRKQSQSLLQVVKTLLVQIDNVTLLLKEIMTEAKTLIGAERCSLFLLDKEENMLVAKVFDGNDLYETDEDSKDIRLPASQGIAGHVAMTGNTLNITDAYSHPLFYRKLDEETGFKTKNILCFPIKDDNGVIGVAELCNKINGRYFTQFDEEIASTFSIYCAICVMHSLMWKKVRDYQSRSRLSNGMIMQTKVPEEEILRLASKVTGMNCIDDEFRSFQFIPRVLSDNEAALATLGMFEDLGFVKFFKLKMNTLIRFVVMVKQGYRDPPYHNWKHGFSVAHFSYLLLKNLKLMGNQLSFLEGLSLFVACLGHDLDHRGTTSSFQVTSKSVLAALYSSDGSVLERHHFAQTVAILHADGSNIFENLSEQEYKQCLEYIRKIILATDLARHFRIIKDIKEMLKNGYNSSDLNHHNLLLCLIVTSCDLSDQTKDWNNTKEIAKLIYKEFFKQGDLEKALGVMPNEMMDREKARIPRLQINFLEQIVSPVYQLLSGFFPQLSFIVDNIEKRKLQWENVEKLFTEELSKSTLTPLEFLDDERVDKIALSV